MIVKNNLVLVPTRGRPKNAVEVLQAHREFSCRSDLLFVVDKDDEEIVNYRSAVGVEYILEIENTTRGMAYPVNVAAKKYADEYDFFTFIGDDHRFRTPDWDIALSRAIGSAPGISYGNDLLQGENLPTAVMMSKAIVSALGGMVPPKLRHLYLDNFWKKIGQDLGNLVYLPDVFFNGDCTNSNNPVINYANNIYTASIKNYCITCSCALDLSPAYFNTTYT